MRLPKAWLIKPAKEICEKIQDGTHFSPKNQVPTGPFPYVTAKNVRPWGLELENLTYLEEEEHRPIYERTDTRKGDVLLVKDGVNAGDAAINTIEGEISLLSSVCFLRPKETLRPKFLRYYLQSPQCRAQLLDKLSGSAIRRIILRKIRELPVIIAPLKDQDAIISSLDTQLSRLDETVATLQGIQAKLKQARASILKAAVEGRLVETATDWKESMKTVGEICLEKPSNGRSVPTQQGGFPVLRLTAMKDGRIDFNEVKGGEWSHADAAKWIVQEGDFFVMRGNGSIKRVGDGALAKQVRFQTAYPDTMIRLRPDPRRCSSGYLLHLWRSPHIRSQIESSARTTAGIYKINQRDIAALLIPIPTLSEQMMIAAEVDRRFSVLDQVEATVQTSLARCGMLRQAILKRAFEGRLVPAPPEPYGP